jgi:hypothetical protein
MGNVTHRRATGAHAALMLHLVQADVDKPGPADIDVLAVCSEETQGERSVVACVHRSKSGAYSSEFAPIASFQTSNSQLRMLYSLKHHAIDDAKGSLDGPTEVTCYDHLRFAIRQGVVDACLSNRS